MADPVRKTDRHYTYADYVTWPDDERWELIHGVAFNISASPLCNHQKILGDLHVMVRAALKPGGCEAYLAPFDVFILSQTDEQADKADTIVEPDLSVICSPAKLVRRGCTGAPDWVVEILSAWALRKDTTVKLELYERAGVRGVVVPGLMVDLDELFGRDA